MVVKEETSSPRPSIKSLCEKVGMSRQNYYAARQLRHKREIDECLVLELVRQERHLQGRLGGRKLLHRIKPELETAGVDIGRDRFFELLAENDLLVQRKPGAPRTTNSRHSLPVYRNRLAEIELTAPNQAFVSDLTYIRTEEGFVYAALIMDAYSRKIVGYHVGDSLESIGCQKALQMALRDLPEAAHPIHHSDRGCQYCCHSYVEMLSSRGLPISMTEILHCYENAKAERLNGILKNEYELDQTFRTKSHARRTFTQAVYLYNNCRPHGKLAYRYPSEVHLEAA